MTKKSTKDEQTKSSTTDAKVDVDQSNNAIRDGIDANVVQREIPANPLDMTTRG